MEAVNDAYFVCVECGIKAKSLYKKFPKGIFDLNKCVSIWFYFRRTFCIESYILKQALLYRLLLAFKCQLS